MGFGTNKTPVEVIKEGAFGGIYFSDICKYFRDMVNDTESHRKNLLTQKVLKKSIIAKVILTLASINMEDMLNVENH